MDIMEKLDNIMDGDILPLYLYLSDYESDVNTRDSRGHTLLLHAAIHGNAEIARLLIFEGANPNIGSTLGITPMEVAIRGKDIAMVETLLKSDKISLTGHGYLEAAGRGTPIYDMLYTRIRNDDYV